MKKVSIGRVVNYIILFILSLGFTIPVITIISISLSDENTILKEGYRIFPQMLSFEAYELVFSNPMAIFNGYKISLLVTLLGAAFGLAISAMCAYAISRNDFRFRKAVTFYLFFTMLFNGGLVPTYILYTQYLHLKNSILALIFPLLVNVFFILVLRTFFASIPFSIIESAVIDGAGEFTIFAAIVIPLSKPALATIGLMLMLNYWNDWFHALLYITNNKLRPLQYMLQQMLREVEEIIRSLAFGDASVDISKLPTETSRMAMAVVAAGPMLFVFPFFQKYFTKGLTVGSVKG